MKAEDFLSEEIKRRIRLNDLVKKISYKPGWRIGIVTNATELSDFISISVPAPDAENPSGAPQMLQHRKAFDKSFIDQLSDRQIMELVANEIRHLEEHEFREWLRIDGIPLNDPHPELKATNRF